jgi:hypothetical protein
MKRYTAYYTLHVACLACLLASVLLSGLFAAVVFPVIKSLEPSLPKVHILQQDHWKMIAGYPAAIIFYVTSAVQLVLMLGALPPAWILARSFRTRAARWPVITTVLASCLWLVTQLTVIIPMAGALRDYRAAAGVNNLEAALSAQATFERYHSLSTAALAILACLLLINIILAPLLLHGPSSQQDK